MKTMCQVNMSASNLSYLGTIHVRLIKQIV